MVGVLPKFVDKGHSVNILNEMHNRVCRGHYIGKTTTHKVMRARFLWPSLFKDAQILVRKCGSC